MARDPLQQIEGNCFEAEEIKDIFTHSLIHSFIHSFIESQTFF